MYFHAEHRNIPWLRALDPDPVVEIHPDTAQDARTSADGEWVWVENWLGRCRFKAKVTLIVPRWMVMATHGWWFPEEPPGGDTSFRRVEVEHQPAAADGRQGKDGLGSPIKHMLCKVYKVRGGSERP